MKYLITITYDGSKYNGLQKLKGKKTVQGELEDILSKLDEKPVSVKSAGRTDKGVHALNQKCHFELSKIITPYKLRYYLNRMSSKNLYIKDCTIVNDDNFHARFSVISKTYIYKINTQEYDAIQNNYIYNYNKELDLNLMKDCSKSFIGEHNYKAFVTGKHKTYNSKIDNISFKQEGKTIIIEIKGQAFYTYMVRNIVSILILVGSKKLTNTEVIQMLKTQKKIVEYSPSPPNGLYLKEVEY